MGDNLEKLLTELAQFQMTNREVFPLTKVDAELLLMEYAPPTVSSVAQAAQKVQDLLARPYPTIVMHPRHLFRLQHERTFERIAPLYGDENLNLDTAVIMRLSPVSMEKTQAYEAERLNEKVAAADFEALHAVDPI